MFSVESIDRSKCSKFRFDDLSSSTKTNGTTEKYSSINNGSTTRWKWKSRTTCRVRRSGHSCSSSSRTEKSLKISFENKNSSFAFFSSMNSLQLQWNRFVLMTNESWIAGSGVTLSPFGRLEENKIFAMKRNRKIRWYSTNNKEKNYWSNCLYYRSQLTENECLFKFLSSSIFSDYFSSNFLLKPMIITSLSRQRKTANLY